MLGGSAGRQTLAFESQHSSLIKYLHNSRHIIAFYCSPVSYPHRTTGDEAGDVSGQGGRLGGAGGAAAAQGRAAAGSLGGGAGGPAAALLAAANRGRPGSAAVLGLPGSGRPGSGVMRRGTAHGWVEGALRGCLGVGRLRESVSR